jgi:hypothetical protein
MGTTADFVGGIILTVNLYGFVERRCMPVGRVLVLWSDRCKECNTH